MAQGQNFTSTNNSPLFTDLASLVFASRAADNRRLAMVVLATEKLKQKVQESKRSGRLNLSFLGLADVPPNLVRQESRRGEAKRSSSLFVCLFV